MPVPFEENIRKQSDMRFCLFEPFYCRFAHCVLKAYKNILSLYKYHTAQKYSYRMEVSRVRFVHGHLPKREVLKKGKKLYEGF